MVKLQASGGVSGGEESVLERNRLDLSARAASRAGLEIRQADLDRIMPPYPLRNDGALTAEEQQVFDRALRIALDVITDAAPDHVLPVLQRVGVLGRNHGFTGVAQSVQRAIGFDPGLDGQQSAILDPFSGAPLVAHEISHGLAYVQLDVDPSRGESSVREVRSGWMSFLHGSSAALFGVLEESAACAVELACHARSGAKEILQSRMTSVTFPGGSYGEKLESLARDANGLGVPEDESSRAEGNRRLDIKMCLRFVCYADVPPIPAGHQLHCTSIYQWSNGALGLLAKEIFPDAPDYGRAMAMFDRAVVRGQVTGDRRELLGAIRKTLGNDAVRFLSRLTNDSTLTEPGPDTILLNIFARASFLPEDQRLAIRARCIALMDERFDGWIGREAPPSVTA